MKRALLAALGLALALPVVAQGPADGKWWKRPRIAKELQLTTEQAAELEKIFARTRPKLIDLRADLEKKQFAYQQAMEDEAADRKTVADTIEAREQARARLQKELALMELDMKQVLTVPQRERLAQMREKFRQTLQDRRRALREMDEAEPPPKRPRDE